MTFSWSLTGAPIFWKLRHLKKILTQNSLDASIMDFCIWTASFSYRARVWGCWLRRISTQIEGFRPEFSNPCLSNREMAIFASDSLRVSYFRCGCKTRLRSNLCVLQLWPRLFVSKQNFDLLRGSSLRLKFSANSCVCHLVLLLKYTKLQIF